MHLLKTKAIEFEGNYAPDLGGIYLLSDIFTEKECEKIIHDGEKVLNNRRGLKQAKVSKKGVQDYRRANIAWLSDREQWNWVYNRLCVEVNRLNNLAWRFDVRWPELIQFTRYTSEQRGHYDWHTDNFGGGQTAGRKLSCSIQLTSPEKYEGGELQILYPAGHSCPKIQGGGVLFPSYIPHRVLPVLKGVRHALVLWSCGPPFK